MIRELKALHPGKWAISYLFDNEPERKTFPADTRPAVIFNTAAELVAFADCTDVHQVRVHHNGRTYRYAGWQPGMLIEFEALGSGYVVWSEYYPDWDH